MILNEQTPSKDDKIEIYFNARDLNKFHTSNGM